MRAMATYFVRHGILCALFLASFAVGIATVEAEGPAFSFLLESRTLGEE